MVSSLLSPERKFHMLVAKNFLETDHAIGRVVRTLRTLTQPSEQPWEVATPILHTGKESQRGTDLSEITQLVRDNPNSPAVGTKQEYSPSLSTRFGGKKKKKSPVLAPLTGWRCDLEVGSPSLGLTSHLQE